MRTSATGLILDLGANGNSVVTVAPGAAPQPIRFSLPAPKYDARGNYPRAEGIVVRLLATITNADTGSLVMGDDLYRIVQSFRVSCPLLGTSHEPDVFTGPVAKHVIEYLALGGQYYGQAVPGVGVPASGEAETTVELFWFLPFTQEAFIDPLGFCPWVGWLTQLQCEVTLAPSTVLSGLSTPATVDEVSLSAWVQATPTKKLALPTIAQWRGYFASASGGSQALLQDVGAQGGLTCVKPGSRLAAILEMLAPVPSTKGMGGAANGAMYTSFACDQLSQPVTQNTSAFLAEYLAIYGGLAGPRTIPFNVDNVGSQSGNPYVMLGTDSASLRTQSAGALFMPWRVPGKEAEIGSQPKFQGNLTLFRTFTAAPTSGQFPIVTNELRELTEPAAVSLLQTAGVTPDRISGMTRDYMGGGAPGRKGSSFAIPVTVPNSD